MSQKTVTARNFKLGQLIVDYLVIIKENVIFFDLLPFAFFRVIVLCKFGRRKLVIKISRKLLYLEDSDSVS